MTTHRMARLCAPATAAASCLTINLLGVAGALPSQGSWQQVALGSPVSKMAQFGFVYDASRDRVVRYGGFACTEPHGRTWEWDGTQWQRVFPLTSPPVRDSTAMAYDSHRKRTVMFGGTNGSSNRDDLWEWDGTTWVELVTAVRPPARSNHMMAYDERRRCVVMFGGATTGGRYFDDTWTWDGTQWQPMAPVNRPLARGYAGMAYDPIRDRIVLFGGSLRLPTGGAVYTDETWEWDGTDWTQPQPAVRPPGRLASYGLVYDHQRRMTVLFGGGTQLIGFAYTDTWGWDGQQWTLLSPSGPPPRGHLGLVYDSRRGRLLMHGGVIDGFFSSICFNDTWVLDGPTTGFTGFGAGCPGPAGSPSLSLASPIPAGVGGTLTLRRSGLRASPPPCAFFVLGGSRQSWNSLSLPWPMTALRLPNCSLWVSPDVVVPVGVQGSTADLTVPIQSPLLFYAQGLLVDPLVPGTGGFSLSGAAGVDAKP